MTEERRCFKCGIREGEMRGVKHNGVYGMHPAVIITHHLKYDGVDDKLVLCCLSCHQKIHNPGHERKCETTRRSMKSHCSKKRMPSITFYELLIPHVWFHEMIRESKRTGIVCYTAYFGAHNGKEIFYVDC